MYLKHNMLVTLPCISRVYRPKANLSSAHYVYVNMGCWCLINQLHQKDNTNLNQPGNSSVTHPFKFLFYDPLLSLWEALLEDSWCSFGSHYSGQITLELDRAVSSSHICSQDKEWRSGTFFKILRQKSSRLLPVSVWDKKKVTPILCYHPYHYL